MSENGNNGDEHVSTYLVYINGAYEKRKKCDTATSRIPCTPAGLVFVCGRVMRFQSNARIRLRSDKKLAV